MYGVKQRADLLDWIPLNFQGVAMKLLARNEQSGATTVLTRMEAGRNIPAHSHTTADETVFVLEGEFIEDGESYGPGSFFAGRAGTVHGPHTTSSGCVLLTTFSSAVDFVMA